MSLKHIEEAAWVTEVIFMSGPDVRRDQELWGMQPRCLFRTEPRIPKLHARFVDIHKNAHKRVMLHPSRPEFFQIFFSGPHRHLRASAQNFNHVCARKRRRRGCM